MKGSNKNICVAGVLGVIFVLMIYYAYADATDPTGPQSITRDEDQRFDVSSWPSLEVGAEAGNVTKLTITSLTQTQAWQGYYGEISGTITLDDAHNYTMYDWALADPEGEIYASNGSSVTWSSIMCVNYSNDISSDFALNLTTLEDMFGMAESDVDGIDETFNESGHLSDGTTDHPVVYVGTHTIAAGTCPATDLYENDSSSGINFTEILLTDNSSIIFTSIIEVNRMGYNSSTWDFQMLVGEDGHDGDDTVTPYYFFVELE